MRARDLVLVVACAGTACVDNPDPRKPTLEAVQRTAYGGWIVITTTNGFQLQGELISVEPDVVRVLALEGLRALPLGAVRAASLYTYESEGGYGAWGILGTLSTISHGFFLAISAPVWIITSSAVAGAETRHVRLVYPKAPWPKLAQWARFPQGMPPGLDPRLLGMSRAQLRALEPPPPPPAPVPPPPPPLPPPGPTPQPGLEPPPPPPPPQIPPQDP